MKCEVCNKTLFQTALYRQNEKGQPAVWRCEEHITTPVDPLVKEITALVMDARNIKGEDK